MAPDRVETYAPGMAHRVVGYSEEEAVISDTRYLKEIDEGGPVNGPAPDLALHYRGLAPTAGLPQTTMAACPPHVALEPNRKAAA
ncbi:MAG TPA: alternative oxidase [Caulobacter sp.]|nr:alternative oxidase [Caulobacter sp.]